MLVGDAGAAPVGVGDVVERTRNAGDHVGHGRDVGRVLGLDEHGPLFVTEAELPDRGVGAGVIDRHEPGDGLLLEPFTGVSGCDRGAGRQVADGHLTGVTDGVVEPETAPEVDAEQLERSDGRLEQSGVERGGCVGRLDGGAPVRCRGELAAVEVLGRLCRADVGVVGQDRGLVRWHATIEAKAVNLRLAAV